MVHWAGEGSDVVLCLARDPIQRSAAIPKPSSLYISYDYGDTFDNKTELLKLYNGKYAIVEKFYNHHRFTTHVSIHSCLVRFNLFLHSKCFFPLHRLF